MKQTTACKGWWLPCALAVDRRGATAVEAAYALPIVVLLTLGTIELSRVVLAQASINRAVTMVLQLRELPVDTLVAAAAGPLTISRAPS